jgi:HEAT repeat protein
LSQLAYETYTGMRWSIKEKTLLDALGSSQYGQDLGGPSAFREALTGRFGVFSTSGDDELEILHQSFAEMLCANWIAETFAQSHDDLRAWLHEHGGVRFLDPCWHEVWYHIAALAPHPDPLLEELWTVHNTSPERTGELHYQCCDDVFCSALGLACHCTAASISRVNTAVSQKIVNAAVCRARKEIPLGSPFARALCALAAAGEMTSVINLLRTTNSVVNEVLQAAAQTNNLPVLLAALKEGNDDVKIEALRHLSRLGQSEIVLPHVRQMVADQHFFIRCIGLDLLMHLHPTPEVIAILIRALHDENTMVAQHAAYALCALDPSPSDVDLSSLADAFRRTGNRDVKLRIVSALGAIGSAAAGAVPFLLPVLADSDKIVADEAANSLCHIGAPLGVGAIPHLIPYLSSGIADTAQIFRLLENSVRPEAVKELARCLSRQCPPYARRNAIAALSALATTEVDAIPYLKKGLTDQEPSVCLAAAKAFLRLGHKFENVLPTIAAVLKDERFWVRDLAVSLLGTVGLEASLLLRDACSDRNPIVSGSAMTQLCAIAASHSVVFPELIDGLCSQNESTKKAAIRALGRCGAAALVHVDRLLCLVKDAEEGVQIAAIEALVELGINDRRFIELCEALLDNERVEVRAAAICALGASGNENCATALVSSYRGKRATAPDAYNAIKRLSARHKFAVHANGSVSAFVDGPLSSIVALRTRRRPNKLSSG